MNVPFLRVLIAIHKTLLTLVCLAFSTYTLAIELAPQVKVIKDGVNEWQQVIANPSKTDSFILISKQGDFYSLTKNAIEPEPFFSKSQVSKNAIELTAVTLHPNFSLREQTGFRTFYTAHSESIDSSVRRSRVASSEVDITFDVVITEWQLTSRLAVDLASKREILRIGVPGHESQITQLSFSPLSKVWNDNFGLLYIGLSQDSIHSHIPLYSGAILRINPTRFGLRNYTIPNGNPFIKQENIHNGLFIIGLQNLAHFIWPKKDENQFLISHQYNNENLLTIAQPKADFRELEPENTVLKSSTLLNHQHFVAYKGRLLTHLWGATLLLTKESNQWQLASISMPDHTGNITTPIKQWEYQPENLNDNGPLAMIEGADKEILMLNTTNQQLSKVSAIASAGDVDIPMVTTPDQVESRPFSYVSIIPWVLLLVAAAWFYHMSRRKRISARHIVKQKFGTFEVSKTKEHISLFRRHQKSADIVMDVSSIVESNILLNGVQINSIKRDLPFSNNAETDLREQFNNERREKMVTDKIRELDIELIDNEGNEYPICVYLRKGDNRITRKKFGDCIEQAIDWCWVVSSSIETESTEVRSYQPVKVVEKSLFAKTILKPTPKNTAQQPIAKKEANVSLTQQEEARKIGINSTTESKTVEKKATVEKDKEPNSTVNAKDSTIDTELVNALEKLANLKAKGVLTPQEFELAKQKVLQGLLK